MLTPKQFSITVALMTRAKGDIWPVPPLQSAIILKD